MKHLSLLCGRVVAATVLGSLGVAWAGPPKEKPEVERKAAQVQKAAREAYAPDDDDAVLPAVAGVAAGLGGGAVLGARLGGSGSEPCPEPVPEPAAFAALGVGAMALARRGAKAKAGGAAMIPDALDLATFAAALPGRLSKDERRIRLFIADLPAVALRIATTEPDRTAAFLLDAGAVATGYINGLNPRKWNLGSLFGRDPLYAARQEVRAFAKRWAMSPVLIRELG